MMTQLIMTKSFPAGLRRVREHRAAGHRTILITGALSFNVEGLRPLFDEIFAAEMSDPARRHVLRRDARRAADRRGPRPDPGRLLRRRRAVARRVRRVRRLVVRPPAVRSGRLPGRRQPRNPAGSDRPQTRLAGRELDEGIRLTPAAAADRRAAERTRTSGVMPDDNDDWVHGHEGAAGTAQGGEAGDGAHRVGGVAGHGRTKIGPLELRRFDDPAATGPATAWHQVHTRLAGICGSDIALVEGHASTYFEDWVSFPFVPGHEVVGELDDGTRVVLEPVLGHAATRHRSPVRRRSTRRRRRLRPPRRHLERRHARARHPDRVLLLDRRRLGAVVLGARVAAAPHRRRHARRASRARRTVRRRHPRRAARPCRRIRRRRAPRSSPCSVPARWASPRSPG